MKQKPPTTARLLRLVNGQPVMLTLGSLAAGAARYEATDEARAAWDATKHMPEVKPQEQQRAA